MATSRIAMFDAHPETVFEALLDATEALEARVHVVDQAHHQVVITGTARRYRLSGSITDNGWGRSTLHLSWNPPGTGAGKHAKRLIKAIGRSLDDLAAPPPPPPVTGP